MEHDAGEAKLVSGVLKTECALCKATVSVPVLLSKGAPSVNGGTVVHEKWCGFATALLSSRATFRGWVSKNGNPIRHYLDDILLAEDLNGCAKR